MIGRKIFVVLLIYTHALAGCVANNSRYGAVSVGPKPSSALTEEDSPVVAAGPKLEVVIPIFDPGLSEKAENYEEEGVWPELRKAEANRFAMKLKRALDDTGVFGAVRVTPDETASGDLYVLGAIKHSTGQSVGIALTVIDTSGEEWMDKSFKHEVSEGFYKNYRKKGRDPYDPVFTEAADAIVALLKKRSPAELHELQYLADLRFGAYLVDNTFAEHMTTRNGRVTLISKPSDADPMWKRARAIRVREQLFIDGMQQNYQGFYRTMDESYLQWQEASFLERQLKSEADSKALMQALGGVLLLGLAVTAGVAASNSKNPNPAIATGAVASGVAGAWMLSKSFKSREEAILHRDAINELGESVNLEFAPRVVEFEGQVVELHGNAKQQFAQWRAFLQEIHQQEKTPDTML